MKRESLNLQGSSRIPLDPLRLHLQCQNIPSSRGVIAYRIKMPGSDELILAEEVAMKACTSKFRIHLRYEYGRMSVKRTQEILRREVIGS